MARITQQQRLIEGLIATARGTPVESRRRKYVTHKRPDGSFYFVGKTGALRFDKTVTTSIAAPEDLKRRLLEENAP